MTTLQVPLTAPLRIADHVPGRRFANVPRRSQPNESDPFSMSGGPSWLEVAGIDSVCRVTLVRPPEPVNVTGVALNITTLLELADTQG